MSSAQARSEHTVTLSDEELRLLLHLLGEALGETRVEVHHTHTPDARDMLIHREDVIRNLAIKLKSLREATA
jgi:hypothetical protein